MPTRSVPAGGNGAATAAHAAPSAFARLRASQAAVDGETRLRRLLLALVVPDLLVVVVLVLTGAFVGAVVTILAALVALAAAVVLSPSGPPAATVAPSPGTDAVVGAQRDEMALLRAQADEAATAAALQVELSHRHHALLLRLLARIDDLEAHEPDPAALSELFALDHLATRMRRCSEGVLVLAGSPVESVAGAPVAASEVLRGAVAEIEDFSRVEVSIERDVSLDGAAAADLVHLLAELVENATVFSADHTRVQVHGEGDASGGYVVSVVDEGSGIGAQQAASLRTLLWTAPGAPLPPPHPGQLGYQVVARLARRHGIVLSFDSSVPQGTLVRVSIPAELVVGDARPSNGRGHHVRPPEHRPATDIGGPVAEPMPLRPPPSILPEAVPAEPAAEVQPYVPEPAVFAVPSESAAATESADLASAAEAGFTGVPHAPTADWAGLPLPIELLAPVPEPTDDGGVEIGYAENVYGDAPLGSFVDGYATDYVLPDEDEVWDAYPDDQLDAAIDGLLDVPTSFVDAPLPEFEMPEFEMPEFEMPELEVPESLPEPDAGVSVASAVDPEPAGFDVPEFDVPAFEVPEFDVPDFGAPDFGAPESEVAGFEVPEFDAPEFDAPEFDVPELEAPAAELVTPDLDAASALVSAHGVLPERPDEDDGLARTGAGLLRRTPQAHLSPRMVNDPFENVLPDDPTTVAAPDRSRALLSAYRDGLVLGRGGLTPGDVRTHLDDRQTYDAVQDETGESA